MSDAERLAHLTLVLRGVLTKPAVDAIVREAEAMVESDKDAVNEVESVRTDIPKFIRAAMGPEPDEDDHDH